MSYFVDNSTSGVAWLMYHNFSVRGLSKRQTCGKSKGKYSTIDGNCLLLDRYDFGVDFRLARIQHAGNLFLDKPGSSSVIQAVINIDDIIM